ncbi:hypothetical protein HDV00_005178 [Rhizophlyctis rosea]|nr:hypothetical protein HDV00_005178 [Rhizophlyctis rosea]
MGEVGERGEFVRLAGPEFHDIIALTSINIYQGEGDNGLAVLMVRMKVGKHTSEEVQALFKERAAIEEDYGKRLKKLAKTFNAKEEIGTLRDSLDVVRAELERTGQARLDLAAEIRAKLEKPLADLIATQSGIRKSHNNTVKDHLKAKAAQINHVQKIKERYETKCSEVDLLKQNRPGLAQKEVDKIRAKLEKTQTQAKHADQEYVGAIDRLAEIHRRWEADFRAACMDCQRLEEDRFHFLRAGLWTYSNCLAGICITDDESCERIRTSLEQCDFDKDVNLFVNKAATGGEIPPPLQYTNFYTGTSGRPSFTAGTASRQHSGSISGAAGSPPSISAMGPSDSFRKESFGKEGSLSSLPVGGYEGGEGYDVGVGGGEKEREALGGAGGSGAGSGMVVRDPSRESLSKGASVERLPTYATGGYDGGLSNERPFGSVSNERPFGSVGGGGGGVSNERPFGSVSGGYGDVPQIRKERSREFGGDEVGEEGTFSYDPFDVPESMPTLFSVRVLYDYKAQAAEELSIVKGQVVPVIATHDDG